MTERRATSTVVGEISPCGLIQETLSRLSSPDWRVLVACSLMNMTTGLTMRPYMWRLFAAYPTPEALAAADVEDVRRVIAPLGLSNVRAPRLVEMSRLYLAGGWTTPMDLPGCGKYATDSWLIFCRGEVPRIEELRDKELRRYVHWLATGEHVPQGKGVDV